LTFSNHCNAVPRRDGYLTLLAGRLQRSIGRSATLLPAYVAGTVGIATIQAVAISLYLNPLWKPIASSLIARIG
jgi:hypothetical protein